MAAEDSATEREIERESEREREREMVSGRQAGTLHSPRALQSARWFVSESCPF